MKTTTENFQFDQPRYRSRNLWGWFRKSKSQKKNISVAQIVPFLEKKGTESDSVFPLKSLLCDDSSNIHYDARFAKILSSIEEMQEYSEEDDSYLERDLAEKSKTVLSLIKELGCPPPNLRVQECDELIFSWQTNNVIYYLVIFDTEIGFIELDRKTSDTKESVISNGKEVYINKLKNFITSYE